MYTAAWSDSFVHLYLTGPEKDDLLEVRKEMRHDGLVEVHETEGNVMMRRS